MTPLRPADPADSIRKDEIGPEGPGDIILVVDDQPPVRWALSRLLKRDGYRCLNAAGADEALQLANEQGVSLVLTDMNMKGTSGLMLIEELKRNDPDIATVMVTGDDDRELAERAMTLGAYGFIVKPFHFNEVLISVSNALRRRTLEIDARTRRSFLEESVRHRTKHLEQSRQETLERLSLAAEFRDDATHRHTVRVAETSAKLAAEIGLDAPEIGLIAQAAPLHDVGKIGVPDGILLKPGRLSVGEFERMKSHTTIGASILSGSQSRVLQVAEAVALTHHERWDGSGYPGGLIEQEIPIAGRIVALADVLDALTHERPYKRAWSIDEAFEEMNRQSAKQFDPDLVEALSVIVKRDAGTDLGVTPFAANGPAPACLAI